MPSPSVIVVIGSGPSGLTTALLLAQQGHRVTILEKEQQAGGLWASRLDQAGFFESENSCKVFQASYKTTPALFELIGTHWRAHFVGRHDLKSQWIRPFLAECSVSDLRKLAVALLLNICGLKSYRDESVYDFLERQSLSEGCRDWMRATALGGITGTMRMTVWELFHRFKFNISSLFSKETDLLYWNKQPPNSQQGFISIWLKALEDLGVELVTGCAVASLEPSASTPGEAIVLNCSDGMRREAQAVFLALPPPAMGQLLKSSASAFSRGWGCPPEQLQQVLAESTYEHLGICWSFDKTFPNDLPLGGNAVRCGWYPILVQYPQYSEFSNRDIETVVIGSISFVTDFIHERLGTKAQDYEPKKLAAILWEDEQRADPSLPDPVGVKIYGISSATQIVNHGPLALKNETAPLYLSTNLNGKAPYFTASLESAIQSGYAAALCFDKDITQLPL